MNMPRDNFVPEAYMFPDEPIRFNLDSADRVLVHAARIGASDVVFQTGHPVIVEVHSLLYPITRRSLDNHELASIVNGIYGQNGMALVKQGTDIDPSYEVRPARGERYRFRVNITSSYAGFEDGVQITVRVINSVPPVLANLSVEHQILDACKPENGLVIISGPTGSGKSTLLSAIMRSILEDPNESKKIITYEAPIEYVYDEIHSTRSLISQHEVPRHIKNFPHAVRNSLRRAPKVILVGECRDPETISAAVEASNTGHTLYTTLHTNSVPESIYRMVNMFPQAERSAKMSEIIESLRLLVTQRLVRSLDGKRVGLREFLVFDDELRSHLAKQNDLRQITAVIDEQITAKQQTIYDAAVRAFNQGLISEATVQRFSSRGKLYARHE